MAKKIVMRTGVALVEADEAGSAAEPEVVIGELDGPVGYAIANLIGDQVKGHTRVWAILNSDVQVRPATLMVSKYTAPNARYTNILMGTVQAAIANAVLDSVRDGHIPKAKVNGKHPKKLLQAGRRDGRPIREKEEHEQEFRYTPLRGKAK